MKFTDEQITAAAAAIANARSGRRGAPPVSNVLDILKGLRGAATGGSLYDEVMEDARAALEAAGAVIRDPRQAALNVYPLPQVVKICQLDGQMLRDSRARLRVFDSFAEMVGESIGAAAPLIFGDDPEREVPLEITLILHPPFAAADAEKES